MNASSLVEPTVDVGESVGPRPLTKQSNGLGSWIRRVGLIGLSCLIIAGLGMRMVPRLRRDDAAKGTANAIPAKPPIVTVATARPSPETNDRVLPGNALPLLETRLFPRATGYIKTRLADIGDRVQAGQLLAEIEAPDLDDQLAQAKANLAAAKANLPLTEANARVAKTTLDRYVASGTGAFSLLQVDQQRATVQTTAAQVDVAKASIQQNEAAVQQFTDLQTFEKITAPFSGIITARDFDPGDLVTANSTTRELYHLMRTDILRVFVNVPQVFATGIRVRQDASAYQRDAPSRQFAGKVTRTADALDPSTRTLLTEVQIPNPDNILRPGMYLQVKFIFRRPMPSVRIPAVAIDVRDGPPTVAVLDANHAVHYRTVQLGSDFGDDIEVLSGIKVGDTVVVHAGDDFPDGTIVEPVQPNN